MALRAAKYRGFNAEVAWTLSLSRGFFSFYVEFKGLEVEDYS